MTEFYAAPSITLNTVEAECAYEGGCATSDENSCGPPAGGGPKYQEGIAGWFKDLFPAGPFDFGKFLSTFFDIFSYLF